MCFWPFTAKLTPTPSEATMAAWLVTLSPRLRYDLTKLDALDLLLQATVQQCDIKLQQLFKKRRQCISCLHETLVDSCMETLMSPWRWLGTCILGYAACDRSTDVHVSCRPGQGRAEQSRACHAQHGTWSKYNLPSSIAHGSLVKPFTCREGPRSR